MSSSSLVQNDYIATNDPGINNSGPMEKTSAPKTEASQQTGIFDPTTLPFGMGMMIMLAFFEILKYLNQMSQQNYQAVMDSVKTMIGDDKNNQSGLIEIWVEQGMNAATKTGQQMTDQAWGSLIGAGVGVLTTGLTIWSGLRNTSSGMFASTEKKAADLGLGNAQKYQTMLKGVNPADKVAANVAEVEADALDGAPNPNLGQVINPATRKNELRDGINIHNYNDKDVDTKAAAAALKSEAGPGYSAALKEAEKQTENATNHVRSFDGKLQTQVNFLNIGNGAGTNAAKGGSDMIAAKDAVESGQDKARAEALQQVTQNFNQVQNTAAQNAQQQQQQQGDQANALANALRAINSPA
ncbi:MAG TPA: hypothetical protein VLE95_04605 [Chlamydiales bacterium]|nr:hypothetical protein [Chlamydiales bacterium]